MSQNTDEQKKHMQSALSLILLTLITTPFQVGFSLLIFGDSPVPTLSIWFVFVAGFTLQRVVTGWDDGLGFIKYVAPWCIGTQIVITLALGLIWASLHFCGK